MFFLNFNYLIFMVPAFILMALTSWYVKSAYNKWSQVRTRSGLTGAEAARRLAYAAGLSIRLEAIPGEMTDHYDPRDKVLRLSRGVGEVPSVAAVAIAAHELGHAMQDAQEYFPLRLRAALVPAVNIGSNLGWVLIMLGLFLGWTQIAWLGILVFSAGAVFALATLPVEFDASARAKRLLAESGIVTGDEIGGVHNVLNAAALTYVAALVTAVMQLLYFVSMVNGRSRR
ncbi:MAG: zinc metallopeptidase [Anaerolineales bacterium]